MKTKLFFYLALLAGFVLHNSEAFSQETKESKKALDVFTKTTKSTIVPHAKVLIELLPGEKGTINTNEKGQFAINFSDIESIQGKNSSEIKIRFTVLPDQNFKFSSIKNEIETTLSKTDGPFFVFTLMYKYDGSRGVGWLEVVQNPSIKQGGQGNQGGGQGAKQGKDPANKNSDNYQGEVRHF